MSKDTKRARAVAAAAELFIRYGFARTTMGDIAQAAEMSRPALYLIYPGKEELFEAAVLQLNAERIALIRQATIAVDGLAEQLYVVCDNWLIEVFALQRQTPDASDMDDLAFPVVRKVYSDLQVLLAEILADALSDSTYSASPHDLARNLVFAVRGLGATARDVEDMRQMTRLHVDLLCGALSAKDLPVR